MHHFRNQKHPIAQNCPDFLTGRYFRSLRKTTTSLSPLMILTTIASAFLVETQLFANTQPVNAPQTESRTESSSDEIDATNDAQEAREAPEQHPAEQAQQSVIVVVGAEGTAEYGQRFREWAERWQQAAQAGEAECVVIGLEPATADDTDLNRLQQAISEHGSRQTPEPLWLVMIGHGTFDTRTALFNLRGPDISAQLLAEWCQPIQRPLAVINCSSCSAPFLNELSGPERVIISATKDPSQIQFSHFGEAMSQAVLGLAADINRDQQTSLLEAWLYASRRTAEFYEAEGRLATEHSLLDDNGDARGVRAELFSGTRPAANVENPDSIDGALAARWHLVRNDQERKLSVAEREQRDQLEADIEGLRKTREQLPEEEYLNQLQSLLVPLAELYEAVDKRTETVTPASPLTSPEIPASPQEIPATPQEIPVQ